MKEKQKCPKCGEMRYMTKHHLKDEDGKQTGEIVKLCRDCHDDAEVDYTNRGINTAAPPDISPNEKLQLKYMNGLLPYYSTK